ncbi:hypothetical protein [Paenibacillus odorifer]|uniref:hypothetical protein n=1 Tax=Paenibacillus TaxID=44249 RepID=UPI00201E6753|nr:hypothetical protein [Paenibacillus odorifer]
MQIFLIRHGDPDYSIDGLTEFGHQEAAALGKRMASIGLDNYSHHHWVEHRQQPVMWPKRRDL